MSSSTGTTVRKVKLDVHAMRDQSGPHCFVLNTSDLKGRTKGGTINLPIMNTQGRIIAVTIPLTFIPIDLSKTALKKDLIDDPNFMRLVEDGRITLVNTEWAQAELRTPESRLEADRLQNEKNKMRMGLKNAGADEDEDAAAPDTSDEAGIMAAVIDIVAREDLTEVEKWSSVKRIENALTTADWKYIVRKTDAERLKALANNKLAEAQGKDRTLGDDD